ncbi:hypothetical protein ABW19_dt0207570 [Dactylella cylindrospora]|nr:hypothetical protein ABW19_dt0207570 [Dactylella cylindrospora]
MGRYLPWRDGPGSSRPRKKIKIEGENNSEDKDKKKKVEEFKEDEYMRDGLANDDYYIMVEDELLQVAKSYTAKLHSAELVRLQQQLALKRSQRKESQSSQQRITASMPKQQQITLHKRNHEAAVKKAASAAGVRVTESEEETYNTQFSSRSLGRLMTASAQRFDTALPVPPPTSRIKLATRAAAGFTKASHKRPTSSQASVFSRRPASRDVKEEEEDETGESDYEEDDDDLDVVPTVKDKRVENRQPLPKALTAPSPISTNYNIDNPGTHNPSAPNKIPTKALASKTGTGSLMAAKVVPAKPALMLKPKLVLTDSDDDYADAEQAERWRKRREAAEVRKLGAKS